MKKAVIALFVFAAVGAGSVDTARAALGVDFNPPNSTYLVPGTNGIAGWSFFANQDLYVTSLGIYDHDADRSHEVNHSIGLWRADGTLLTSVSFTEPAYPHLKDLVNGKYHMILTSAMLQAGQQYVIAATMGTSDPFAYFPNAATATAHSLIFSPYLTYAGAVYANSTIGMPGPDPLSPFGNFGANIDVTPTPVPAAAWLLGSGLIGLAGTRRRNN